MPINKKLDSKIKSSDYDLFPKGQWDAPQWSGSKKGDPTPNAIYLEVGQALSTWERLETVIADMFLVMTRPGDTYNDAAMRRTFGSVENTIGRLKIITELAKIHFSPYYEEGEIKWQFDAYVSSIRISAQRRNEIAHGIATGFMRQSDHQEVFLIAPSYITARNYRKIGLLEFEKINAFSTSNYCYNSQDIASMSKKFLTLSQKIWDYIPSIIYKPKKNLKVIDDFISRELSNQQKK